MDVRHVVNTLRGLTSKDYNITTVDDQGSDIVINCPYHKGGNERTGSFSILTEDKVTVKGVIPAGTGHCFACGTTKMLPQLVADVTSVGDYDKSKEWLEREFNYAEGERQLPITMLLQPKDNDHREVDVTYQQYRVQYHEFFERRRITPQ